jgi:hypothetical protein
MSGADPKAFDERFEKADLMRCEGGEGRFHQGRFPYDKSDGTGVSETKFSVFVGFKGLYTAFPEWFEQNTDGVSYGSVFARTSVGQADAKIDFAGNLPAEPKIRNRNAKGYLANLLWGKRDRHQSLMYDFRDSPRILPTLARDAKAHVVIIRHSWLIELLQKSTSFENQLVNAKRFQRLERRFLASFDNENSAAKLVIIDLEDALAHPLQALVTAIEHIPGKSKHLLNVMPERSDLSGLDNLARKLRNNGLKIDYEPPTRAKENKKQDTVFEKPYVVK